MEKRVALVTGASSGIGKQTALKFAQKGYRTVICDLNDDDLYEVEDEITNEGGEVLALTCDIAHADEVKGMIDKIIQEFGRLDVACNNAGIEGTTALTADYTIDEWDRVMNVNLRGQWLCMKYEIPQMIEHGGSIINMSSILGQVAFEQAPGYVAAKHGLIGLTKAAALDYAKQNIRINAVCPGFIDTPMLDRAGITTDPDTKKSIIALHPIGRLGKAEEIANAVVWLASDEASFITGHSLLVDGGYVIK
ncbi:MAG: SDR family oxidoreductase [Balneolaceae bacterium]|jgi:NAD(P)-dependent dehydrogenase (short-subunit alcohol dehydrogenase family)